MQPLNAVPEETGLVMTTFATRGITFHPNPGEVLMCDFEGNVIPEMVKLRPVVVVAADHPAGTPLCLVVPFSTRKPEIIRPVHFHVPAARYPFSATDQWVKADLITHASFARLDRIRVGGRYQRWKLPRADLVEVQKCVLHALGFGYLTGGVSS
jgi:mRNA interferase MazF